MSKTQILEELSKLTKTECQEISDDRLDDEEPLTIHEKLLLEVRLAAYAKDPDAGSIWEEVEDRIQVRLTCAPNGSKRN